MMQQITVLILLSLINFYSLAFASNLQLTKGDLENYGSTSPSFSTDGKKVVYTSSKNRTYHIWVMDFDGTNKKELTNLSYDRSPAWSPTNDIIAFQSYGPDLKRSRFSIWMLNIKAGNSWEFIEPDPHGDKYPCWSPNGEEIVWSHGKQLWISDSKDSKNARSLTTTAAMAFEFCGDWDPSGEWIAYIAADTYDGRNPYKIWIIRRNGKDQKLLHCEISALRLKWSRDGQSIYFSNGSSLMRVNVRGKCKIDKVFDFNSPYEIGEFDISPNGRKVVFSVNESWPPNQRLNTNASRWSMRVSFLRYRYLCCI